MRLWSFHPSYLDNIGLARLYNEGIGGIRAIRGEQKMHLNHPQLTRFKVCCDNHTYIILSAYLRVVHNELELRGMVNDGKFKHDLLLNYLFQNTKDLFNITVNSSQINGEIVHFINKTKTQKGRYINDNLKQAIAAKNILPHPLFTVVPGPVESWEKSETVINYQA